MDDNSLGNSVAASMTALIRAIEYLHDTGFVSRTSGSNLERSLHPVVMAVAERGEASVGQVAADLGIRSPTASHHVRVLMDRGLVERVDGVTDQRRTVVRLTATGRQTRASLLEVWGRAVMEVMAAWPRPEAEDFARRFASFAAALREVD